MLRQEGVPGGSDGCFLKPLQKLRRKLVRGCNFLLSSSANFEFLLIAALLGARGAGVFCRGQVGLRHDLTLGWLVLP